jgi:transmembrane sensor
MNNHYTTDYFLRNPEFIRWVQQPDSDHSGFWHSFSIRHPEAKEEMIKAVEIIRSLKIKRVYSNEQFKQDVLNDILARIADQSQKTHGKSRILWKAILRYAAVFLIISGTVFSIYWLSQNNNTGTRIVDFFPTSFDKEVPFGAKLQTRLPDGSMVWINAGSRLAYFEDSMSKSRTVTLSGEAFFDVVEDPVRPFIVNTPNITVKVLGTSFNVVTYDNESQVALLTGKVDISNKENGVSSMELQPGEKAILDHTNGKYTKEKLDYLQDIGWKDGILSFKRASFGLIREKLERWYGVKIIVTDENAFSGWDVDGQYKNKSLEMTLEHLSYTKEFNYKIVGKEVYITK